MREREREREGGGEDIETVEYVYKKRVSATSGARRASLSTAPGLLSAAFSRAVLKLASKQRAQLYDRRLSPPRLAAPPLSLSLSLSLPRTTPLQVSVIYEAVLGSRSRKI